MILISQSGRPTAAAVEATPMRKVWPLRLWKGSPARRTISHGREMTADLARSLLDWKEKRGPEGSATSWKECCIAVTAQTWEPVRAMKRDWPNRKESVLKDRSVTTSCCAEARLGTNDTHPVRKKVSQIENNKWESLGVWIRYNGEIRKGVTESETAEAVYFCRGRWRAESWQRRPIGPGGIAWPVRREAAAAAEWGTWHVRREDQLGLLKL